MSSVRDLDPSIPIRTWGTVQVAQFNRELAVISHVVVVVSLTARSFRIAP
ncbi:MAG TPA: hypothetical protein VGV15_11290 [Terriglobales bacterium]|nr:hypothetical protein [Terriglobales bacterium]